MLPLLVAALVLLALSLRFIPIALSPRGVGIDHWFWKTYIDTYRRDRRFPPELPQYILDEHQWYPPLFPLILSILPERVFNQFATVIAIGIDIARMLMLLLFAYSRTNGSIGVIAIAGLLYATSPIQISYNTQLNPRGLAALMLDGLLILLLVRFDAQGPWWVWPIVILLSGLILLTHKMTTQLLWFLIVGTAIIYRNWLLLWLLPSSIAAALILSRGFYWNVLLAHWDIVSFWNKHWRWIGADLIRESPIYGDGRHERPEKLHRRGARGMLRQAATLFGFNPAAWIGCLLVYERLWLASPVLIFPTQLLVWLLLCCLFACLTTYITWFKCVGAGYLYVYNASLITSLLLGIAFEKTLVPGLSKPLILGTLCANVAAVSADHYQFYRNKRARVHEGLDHMIDTLREMPRGVVMCIPANWYDVVAYKTGQPVLWGAHGYGFGKIEPTFPRLLIPIRDIVQRYTVRYLITMDGMLTEAFVDDLPPAAIVTQGEYRLYCFAGPPERAVTLQD